MWVQTVWHWICILVFFSGIIDLLLNRSKVFYKSGYVRIQGTYQISVCLKIDSELNNCSSLSDKQLSVCESLKSYFEYVESEQIKTPQEIIQRFKQTNLTALFSFNDEYRIDEKYNYLNLNHLCTLYRAHIAKEKVQKKGSFQVQFFNKFHLSLKLFLFPATLSRYLRYEYLSCENFKSCTYFNLSLREHQSIQLPSSSDADCIDYSSKSFYFQRFEPIISRSSCLQECFKYKQRFSEFYYSENDTLPIQFNRTEHYELLDSALSYHFKHCKDQCSKPTCSLKYFHFGGIIYNQKQNHVRIKIGEWLARFEALPDIETFRFWRKLLGFLSLFFKISILSLVLHANKLLRYKMQQPGRKKKSIFSILLVLVWLFLVSSFLCGSFLATQIYHRFAAKNLTEYIYYEVPFVPVNFSIALCEAISRPKSSSLIELKEPAKQFNASSFIVKFGIVEESLILLNKRFFYKSLGPRKLEHCFSTDVHIKEPRYRSLLSLTNLLIKPKRLTVYLEQFNRSFTTKSLKMKKNAKIRMYGESMLTECKDYQVLSEGKCDSQKNCIDMCYNEEFLRNFSGFSSFGSLIYFEDYPKGYRKSLSFVQEKHEDQREQILKGCKEKYSDLDCQLTSFYSNLVDIRLDSPEDVLAIDPFFFQIKQGNLLDFNLFQMICSFVTLSTIITGLNWPRTSNTAIKLLNFFLKEEDRLNLKNIFFLISFIGFFGHAYYILQQTCSTDLDINSKIDFDFLNSNKIIPDLVICLEHDQKFESNEEPTFALLAEKTRWLNETYLFEEIIYFDSNMRKQTWSPASVRSDSPLSNTQVNKNLEIRKWFMHSLKCFTIAYRMNSGSAKNYVINSILKLKFNPKRAEHNQTFIFSSKHSRTEDFSNYYRLDFKALTRVNYACYRTTYYDQYQTLANPRLWFQRGHKINVGASIA